MRVVPIASGAVERLHELAGCDEPSVEQAMIKWRPKLKDWYTELQNSKLSTDNDDKTVSNITLRFLCISRL